MSTTFSIPKTWGLSVTTGNVSDVALSGGSFIWKGRDVSSLLTTEQKDSVRARYAPAPTTTTPEASASTSETTVAAETAEASYYIAPDFGSLNTALQTLTEPTTEQADTAEPKKDYTLWWVLGGIVGLYLLVSSKIK